eukprot:m.113885 g.113885  ORF g.113885 m.113885 type:complete len:1025 (-) comp15458_c0_seq1:111-3185(-)
MVFLLTIAALVLPATMAANRPVDRYNFEWGNPGGHGIPSSSSFGSPYVGNGDIGVAWSSPTVDRLSTGEQVLSMGKNDFWTSEGKNYFNHNAAPTLSFALPSNNYSANITQHLGSAKLTHVLRSIDNLTTLSGETIVGEAGSNAVLTTLICDRQRSTTCPLTITLRDCCNNNGGFAEYSGGTSSSIFFRKENLQSAVNGARTGSCNPLDLYYNVERQFVIKDSVLTMSNGSCPWVLQPNNVSSSPITTGSCTQPQGQWHYKPVNGAGNITWVGGQSLGHAGLCLQGGTIARVVPCSKSTATWVYNTSRGYLQSGGSCLMVVPDNTNNTLATAAVVLQADTGKVVRASSPPRQVNSSNPASGITYTVPLTPGVEYVIVTAVMTLRDIGCAGTRAATEQCTTAIETAATSHAMGLSQSGSLTAVKQKQAEFWSTFWNASSIDLTGGVNTSNPNATVIERWYYGMQYSFGTNVRQGKVTPSLSGVLVTMDPVAWHDQFTLDYNLESNFWGAGSSNRADYIKPYMASVTSPPLVASMRQRAANPGVWNHAPDTKWPGTVGSTVGSASCGGHQCAVADELGHKGGYNGTAWVSTAFPLGDGRPAPTDLATRFIGGLLATPLVQYFEYTRDMSALRNTVYPFVRDNAEFYASYAFTNGTGPLVLPYTCAQEACNCRDNTDWYWRWGKYVEIPLPNMTEETATAGIWPTTAGEHNAHADIAFAAASFRKAEEYAALLGVDQDLQTKWASLLARMPAYPTQTLTWVKNASAISVGAQLSGLPLMVEAEPAPTPAQAAYAKAAGNSTVIWPWCNANYPISNFAAMWPTDEVGSFQTQDPNLLATAKRTVLSVNNYTGFCFACSRTAFANDNGFGLSWPPAVRVAEFSDAAWLLGQFAHAATIVTAANGIDSNHGGMLENMGAVVAINDMLFQSHGGALRFFPVWDATTMGPASFTTLRGYGAFLASAAIDAQGQVSPIEVISQVGGVCTVESPWPGLKVLHKGEAVPTTSKGRNVFTFATDANETYILEPGSL